MTLLPSPLPPRDPVVDWWISHRLHIPPFRLRVRDDYPGSQWRNASPELVTAFRKTITDGLL